MLDPAEIQKAAEIIRNGGLVVFPTETVYGLGANALDAQAVRKIYALKQRPATSPLIVHVASVQQARELAADWPDEANRLAREYWPGPLTLVVPKKPIVPDEATAGLPTVGVRMPAHPIALALLTAARVPIAAPSANRFTEVSPTTAEHVRRSLGDRVDYILDGGPCPVGIESTVLSLVESTPILLRPGGVSRQQIEEVIGPVASRQEPEADKAHRSPGLHPRHYSPHTRLYLVENGKVPGVGRGAYVQLAHAPEGPVTEVILMPTDAAGYAARLYEVLHFLDGRGPDWIAVDTPPDLPEWEAVQDRLRRAASSK